MSTHRVLPPERICCDGFCVQGRLCPLRRRPTLNGLTPRTAQDATRDAYDWTDMPIDEPDSDEPLGVRVFDAVLVLIAAGLIVAACLGFFS